VDAEAGRANFYGVKLCRLGIFQPFYVAGREGHEYLGTEFDYDPPGLAIIVRGNYSRDTSFHFHSAFVCQFETVTRCHELIGT
jgi:hypothetical protein